MAQGGCSIVVGIDANVDGIDASDPLAGHPPKQTPRGGRHGRLGERPECPPVEWGFTQPLR